MEKWHLTQYQTPNVLYTVKLAINMGLEVNHTATIHDLNNSYRIQPLNQALILWKACINSKISKV